MPLPGLQCPVMINLLANSAHQCLAPVPCPPPPLVCTQVAAEFPGVGSSSRELQSLLSSCPSSLMYSWASPELVRRPPAAV